MIRLYCLLFLGLILFSCKEEKRSLSDETIRSVDEFVESFPDIKLPLSIHDSSLKKKPNDSMRIADKLVQEFIPDSLYARSFRGRKPRFYGVGKAMDKNEDVYVIIKVLGKEKQMAYVLCFDKERVFKAGMPLLGESSQRDVSFEGVIDRKFTIYRNSYRQGKAGQLFYSRNAYVYNNVGTFTLILKESNDIPEEETVYNPIDTLPSTQKFTGDYVQDKKNFVSVRDGSKPGRIRFFIHFEKRGGDCTGELKGEAVLKDAKKALYTAPGDPCALELNFTGTAVQLKEVSGCGNYRGIKCFFEGQYPLKKRQPSKRS